MLTRKISADGLRMIQHFEGFVELAYLDKRAVPHIWTVGYGETQLDGRPVREHDRLPIAAAAERLRVRCDEHFGAAVCKTLGVVVHLIEQHQFDACVSLTYNIGTAGFNTSTVARKISSGDIEGAGAAFLMWDKAGGKFDAGLLRRREEERQCFDAGKYPV